MTEELTAEEQQVIDDANTLIPDPNMGLPRTKAEIDAQSQPGKLSYAPGKLPSPVSTSDVFLHAILVELRATRKAIEDLADQLAKPATEEKKATK